MLYKILIIKYLILIFFSCRNAVVEVIENSLGIKLDKRLEIDSGSELTEQFLQVLVVK